MFTILAELREGDFFNIITFSDKVQTWKRGRTVQATRHNIRDAKEFIRKTSAEGCESRVRTRTHSHTHTHTHTHNHSAYNLLYIFDSLCTHIFYTHYTFCPSSSVFLPLSFSGGYHIG